jgi:SAM-dependent methyltransferase
MTKDYHTLVAHYERCFRTHGATPQGVDWPKAEDVRTRFAVMLGIATGMTEKMSLLDLGCGYGALYDYLQETGQTSHFDYRGIDLSAPMIEAARARHPAVDFSVRDIIREPLAAQNVDLVVMNGVLTEKRELSFAAMEEFAVALITAAFQTSRLGVSFNVMSAQVEYERDDLFHWPFDRAATLLKAQCSRHLQIRADYGLYEYTLYLRHHPHVG